MKKIDKIVVSGVTYSVVDSITSESLQQEIERAYSAEGELKEDILGLNAKIDSIGEVSSIATLCRDINYSELVTLRDNSELVPGMKYRIIDYVTTTTQKETKSAGHAFDIIVEALSVNDLSEKVRAIQHEGDTYFEGNDLGAWEIWYNLDNDTSKYEWADATNGKGVIYRMIDEFSNDCPYDFKNILFYNDKYTSSTTSDKYYYTFSYVVGGILYDGTTEVQVIDCFGNSFGGARRSGSSNKEFYLNKNTWRCDAFYKYCYNNTFGSNCYNNTFGSNCYNNTFGSNCNYNTFGDNCDINTFEGSCWSITFGNNCNNNTLKDSCSDIIFGDNCDYNTFGNNCKYNIFGNSFIFNVFGDGSKYNTFGDNCDYNTFGNNFYSNTFGNNCRSNIFGNSCNNNTFGNDLINRQLNYDKISITLNDEYYDDGSGQLVPTKHPDLSTQPSILPYKFMGQYVYEQLIPVMYDSRIQPLIELETNKPAFLSASTIGLFATSNVDIQAVNEDMTAIMLKDSILSSIHKYIKVIYTDGSLLVDNSGYYGGYGYSLGDGTNSTIESSFDFGISNDGAIWIYDKNTDTLTLDKKGEITSKSLPNNYKNSKNVIISNSVTSIGDFAFNGCTGLTSIEIPNSVTRIGRLAFRNCSELTDIEIPNSIISIEEQAFYGCSSLTSIEIPNSVTSIGRTAFAYCSGLISIVIPNSITSIRNEAFKGCSGLTRVIIGNSVTSIESTAFDSCKNLKTIVNLSNLTFSKGSYTHGGVARYADNIINAPSDATKIEFVGDFVFVVVNEVNTLIGYIGDKAEVILPENYNGDNYVIGKDAFYKCTSLTSIVIPNSVTSIGEKAFGDCSGLTNIVIPDSITRIEIGTFSSCHSLAKLILPSSIVFIGWYSFYDCSNLSTVICYATNPPILDFTSEIFEYNRLIYVPDESVDVYKGADVWKANSDRIKPLSEYTGE